MYNKSEIMKRAWELYKYWIANNQQRWTSTVLNFAQALRSAWGEAESAIRAEAEKKVADDPRVIEIDKKLFFLNMSDRWSFDDQEIIRRLRAERDTIAHEILAA